MELPSLEARRTPRVAYNGAIELLSQDDESTEPRALAAAAIDLGEGGMRVEVSERVPIGAPLTCRISLDGRETALEGRVAWLRTHTAPRPHGMGIRFEHLPAHERELIAHVVERSAQGYRAVELQFAGLPTPIVARALPQPSGLLLSAPLPILERGTQLQVRLESESPALEARIGDVRVIEVEGARRLEVEVELAPDQDGARVRRAARYGLAAELHEDSTRPSRAVETSRARAWTRRTLPLVLATGAGVALGFLVAAALQQPRTPARAAAAPNPVAPAPVPTLAPLPTPAPTPAPAPPSAPNIAVEARTEGDATYVRIPFSGSLAGMVARQWARPKALALDLPDGRSALADGVHPARAGSVQGLRVNRREHALLLRVQLTGDVAHYSVSAQDSALEIRLLSTR